MSKNAQACRRVAAAIAAGCAGLALAGAAQALDLRDWGRKYNTASERFVVLVTFSNEAVLDKETQLVWRRDSAPKASWANAVAYCAGSLAGGRSGWRLPSISELTSLRGSDGKIPAGHPFQFQVDGSSYLWSSTDSPFGATAAFQANLVSGGNTLNAKTLLFQFLCVRGPT